MPGLEKERADALESIREQLGSRITSGAELLRERERSDQRLAVSSERLNDALGGGLARGQLTEVVGAGAAAAGGLVMAELLADARREGRYVMLLDVGRGFAPEDFPAEHLESLLWVGCDSTPQAVEALDVATRDENVQLFLLDLRDRDPSDWRSVRASQWHRVLGQLRSREAAAVIFADAPVTSATKRRIEATAPLSVESLHRPRAELVADCRISSVETEAQGERRSEESARRRGEPLAGLRAG